MNLQEKREELLFIPLGGTNEIGMNLNVYCYQGKFLLVDCGSGFAGEEWPGVNMLVADISFIKQNKENIVGLFLTHAHEDHLGGIQYLWKDLQCPIYCTNFTANFLKARFIEYRITDADIHVIKSGSSIQLGPFNVETIGMTHSAPEMQALMIRTSRGNVLHTGDWKLDNNPLVGPKSDLQRLKECGDEGVLALVCDSTNVFMEGHSGSEGDLKESLTNLIQDCDKLCVVTTFASNLARLDTLMKAAKQCNRKVILAGRSLHRMAKIAEESGYDLNFDDIIDDAQFGMHHRKDLLVIATGCQGEPLATVSKMINETHNIKLTKGDTIIFSSKIIPGNEKRIFHMFNEFVKRGIEVITEKDHFVHVSGHPAVDELRTMYELVRPEIAIPVHGEPVHIHEHIKLAKKFGVKNAIEVENGTVVNVNGSSPCVLGKVKSGYYGIDGDCMLPEYSPIFKARRIMNNSGVVVVNLVTKRGNLVADPVISYPGCLDENRDKRIMHKVSKQVSIEVKKKHGVYEKSECEKIVRSTVKRIIKNEIGKYPLIVVNICDIDNK